MQDSTTTNSVTKPKLRKSLRLRKKRCSNKFQNNKRALSSELLFARQDPVDADLCFRAPSSSSPNGQSSHPIKRSDDMLTYSTRLLELCNKLVKEDKAHSGTVSVSASMGAKERRVPLYSPLTQDSLLYPYASLLLGLHKKVTTADCQTAQQGRRRSSVPDRSLSRIMNNLDHPIDTNANEYKMNCDNTTSNSYTKKIQNFVILEALRKTIIGECEGRGRGCADKSGESATVGEVMSDLGQQRARTLYPSDEFYYSSLLLKACSASSDYQSTSLHLVSDDGGDNDSNLSSFTHDRDCSTSSNSDSYEEWSPSYRKRKVRRVRKRSTKTRIGDCESSSQALLSPGEGSTHQNNAPTLLKLLLSKDGRYDGAGAHSAPPQSRSVAAASNITSQGSSANGLHGSLLKNFLSKPSDEFQKYYSKIKENRENSTSTTLQKDSDMKCLRGQSSNGRSTSYHENKIKKETSSIPDLIPCSLIPDTNPSCVADVIKSESREIDVGCTFLDEHENKPAPQAMSLTVASMLCRLKLYPPGEGGTAACTATVISTEDKQGLGTGGEGRCRSKDEEAVLEEHQCSLCHLPFVSSLDLQCHQSLFHASHSTSEKLRN